MPPKNLPATASRVALRLLLRRQERPEMYLVPMAIAVTIALSTSSIASAANLAPVSRIVEERAQIEGERVPVLVALREPDEPSAAEDPAPRDRPGAIARNTERAIRGLDPRSFSLSRQLSNSPVFSARVTKDGLDALRRRPEVRAITLDGIVHPAGQAATVQIGVDRMTSLGMTGYGRTVVVIDTGLDSTHPDLGGGAGPNPRIRAGWNLADDNPDFSDCSGHGTEVAGVLAGPQGVAPDADLIVLKVFSTRDGCSSASFSDILAAVDWSVSIRREMHIEAINLSLADDRRHAGFCDADDPVSEAVFSSARAAGIAVVAAAGNDGKKDGIAWPGCFSSVAAAGMVYSASQGPTAWGGSAGCQDAYTAPDVVPCASNWGSVLGLLAPGVGWTTPTAGGGRTSSFSGTSAAAPALTGAILLTRQARPLFDPLLALDLLRATGNPVRDDRNGRVTPRLALAPALDAASPVTGPCEPASIPDGGGTVCDAFVSSLTGEVSSLAVALTIDHPDPTQLVATLTAPDGTSVLLMNRSGTSGHPVREVFGRTAESIEPLSSFEGGPASGRWRLQVLDTVPGGVGRIVSWALLIESRAPTVSSDPFTPTGLFPAVTHHQGKFGAFFRSSVRFFNSDPTVSRPVTLSFSPSAGSPERRVTVTVPPLGTRVLDDVLGDGFRTSDYGPLFFSAPPEVVPGCRTEATAPRSGSYGSFTRPVDPRQTIGAGDGPLLLLPPIRVPGFRVNIGLTETRGYAAEVEVLVKDRVGALKGAVRLTVAPWSLLQINDIYGEIDATADRNDRYEVLVTGGLGGIATFASAVDNGTNDALVVYGTAPASDLLFGTVSQVPGGPGVGRRTDLKIANPSSSPIRIKVRYFAASGPAFDPRVIPIGAGTTRLLVDVLDLLFAPKEPVSGALRLTVLDGGAAVASSHTYSEADGGVGTHGLAVEPATGPEDATAGKRIALTFLTSSPQTHTGVGFLETSGRATTARLTLYSSDGSTLGASTLSFDPYQAVQWDDVFERLSIGTTGNASALLEVLSGGSLVAQSIQTDNRTMDTTFIPGTLLK